MYNVKYYGNMDKFSLTGLVVSQDLLRSTVTSQIAFDQRNSHSAPEFEHVMDCCRWALSLISTHTFRKSPANFFARDMRRVVKQTDQDEKISFALFAFEVQIFQLLRNFLSAKPIRVLC